MKWFSFSKEKNNRHLFFDTDLHSHILPGIDDGSPDLDYSITLLKAMQSWGIRRIFTTPHIIVDRFENTRQTIEAAYQQLKERIEQENIDINVRYSAEYRIDEHFRSALDNENEDFIELPGKQLLVENSFLQAPIDLDQVMFKLMLKNYQPILAHPERYSYYHQTPDIYQHLHNNGVLFQINILSLTGYYGSETRKAALWLCKNGLVDYLGSDLHNIEQAQTIERWIKSKSYEQILPDLTKAKNSQLL